ncbi:hypothetical protein M758_UG325200, partial [Ceratodon purpureus]
PRPSPPFLAPPTQTLDLHSPVFPRQLPLGDHARPPCFKAVQVPRRPSPSLISFSSFAVPPPELQQRPLAEAAPALRSSHSLSALSASARNLPMPPLSPKPPLSTHVPDLLPLPIVELCNSFFFGL